MSCQITARNAGIVIRQQIFFKIFLSSLVPNDNGACFRKRSN
jgi:hypothetical protein